MLTTPDILRKQMDDAWCFLTRAINGVDDVLLHWEPSIGSWGLRLKDGRWLLDYPIPDPIPPGPKTIGWLIGHLATCKEMHCNILFGSGQKKWDRLTIPGDADKLIEYLHHTHQNLRRELDHCTEAALEHWILTTSDSGERLKLWQALWFDIYHDFQHGGQIFQIRNEFAMRHQLDENES